MIESFLSPSAAPHDVAPDGLARHAVPSQLLHDLRTPLHQIIGYAEMLVEQAQEEGRAEWNADLQKVRVAGGQLLALLERHFAPQKTLASASQFASPIANGAAIEPPELVAASRPLLPLAAFGGSELASGAPQGRILVVDDNATNREVLARLLGRQGYEIEAVENGNLALQRANSQSFDLILLDIMMPQMDGYEVLQTLKASESTRHLPVIMISALGEIDSVVRCIELGAEDYLPKPFNPTLLKARIGACLEKKRGRDREVRLFAQLQENYGRLQALEKMRDDLTHMIVHDLRTPLSSILAGLQTMPMVAPLLEAQQECLDIAMRGGFTLLGLINDLLDISKMEAAQMELELSPVAIGALVESALEQVAASARNRGLNLHLEIASDLPILQLDEDKVGRALVNLLGNALKFTPRGGQITLSARAQRNGDTLFEVRDTGEGIPAQDFERIFDKFSQVEERRAGRRMSTGLGLALCKMVIEAHGGRIWVESQTGQGSSFFFTLPASAAAKS